LRVDDKQNYADLQTTSAANRLLLIYHFFFPDDVVSARVFSSLAEGLVDRGWKVSVLTSNRIYKDQRACIRKRKELWHGIMIHRVFRPAFNQASNFGRAFNSIFLIIRWVFFILSNKPYDAIVLGTDPAFGYLMFPLLKFFRPNTRLIYWSFDMYPEAIMADNGGGLSRMSMLFRPLTRICYSVLDGIADIGPCMRRLLDGYRHRAVRSTLVPWALIEPEEPLKPDFEVRNRLFGNAKLTILYSGTIGKAHEFDCFINLARELRRRGASISFCFAGRGNRYHELREMVKDEDTNIFLADFIDEKGLQLRLGAGDIHMISLRRGWEGVVVPSKFFGSLAVGRPLLYQGSEESSIKMWIEKFGVGYCVNNDNIEQIADELCKLSHDPFLLSKLQWKAKHCYNEHFSRKKVLDEWNLFLKSILFNSVYLPKFDWE